MLRFSVCLCNNTNEDGKTRASSRSSFQFPTLCPSIRHTSTEQTLHLNFFYHYLLSAVGSLPERKGTVNACFGPFGWTVISFKNCYHVEGQIHVIVVLCLNIWVRSVPIYFLNYFFKWQRMRTKNLPERARKSCCILTWGWGDWMRLVSSLPALRSDWNLCIL